MRAFPLQALLELRERERDEAFAAVSVAQADVNLLQRAIAALEADRIRVEELRENSRQESSADVAAMLRLDDYIRALDVELAEADQRIEQHADALRDRIHVLRRVQLELSEAQVALEAVQKQHESWLAQRRLQATRTEEAEAEEIALRRWRDQNE